MKQPNAWPTKQDYSAKHPGSCCPSKLLVELAVCLNTHKIQAEWLVAAAFLQWLAQGAQQIRSIGKRSMQAKLPVAQHSMVPFVAIPQATEFTKLPGNSCSIIAVVKQKQP